MSMCSLFLPTPTYTHQHPTGRQGTKRGGDFLTNSKPGRFWSLRDASGNLFLPSSVSTHGLQRALSLEKCEIKSREKQTPAPEGGREGSF